LAGRVLADRGGIHPPGRTVTVKIKWADFEPSTRSQSLARPVDSRATLHEPTLALIRSVFPRLKGIRLVGVTLSNFAGRQDSVSQGLSLLPESDAAA
jgi:DNA polymerase IV